ncbi:MAG: glycosyltransferase family 4 protein [Bacteroidota bacterium]|nr:glycosyltransferase family 4 protein [Bacteroidota bacterium]
MQQLKIAILSSIAWRTPPTAYGPWEQVASNHCEELVNLGHDVTLFATGNSVTNAKLCAVVPSGYAETQGMDAKVWECLHISNLMEQAGDFDIIHNHFDFLPLTYSRLVKTPIVTTIHGFSSNKIVPVYKKYNDTSHYVSISYSDRHNSLNYTANVYNGIDSRQFTFNETSDDYLLFFGRIHPDKGTLDACKIALATNKQLIIAGLIQDADYYNQKIASLVDNNQIKYIGNVGPDKRNELLGKALAVLHPIHFDEPFGLSVAEAMMCGTPIIAYNRGSMPEIIKQNVTGYIVENLEEAINMVPKLKLLSRKDCRQHSLDNYSMHTMAKGYVEVYNKIL